MADANHKCVATTVIEVDPSIRKESSMADERSDVVVKDENIESQQLVSSWKPGVWRQFPWLGICGLFTVLLCSVASLLILHFSNGKPASKFLNGHLAPNVLLSIFNNLSSLAITLAVGEGIAISWWRRALSGDTVNQLHYSWSFSTEVAQIFTKFKYFNAIALAALMTKIAVIDGVLYQKAMYTYLDIIPEDQNTTIHPFAATVFPQTAKMGPSHDLDGLMSFNFEKQVIHWDATGDDIDQWIQILDCGGPDCHYFLEGAGFSMSCNTTTTRIDYGKLVNTTLNEGSNASAISIDQIIFAINFTRVWPSAEKNYSALVLDMTHVQPLQNNQLAPTDVCPMDLNRTICELRPAVLKYKLQYTNASAKALSNEDMGSSDGSQPSSIPLSELTYLQGLQASMNSHPSGVRLDYDCPVNEPWDEIGCSYYDEEWKQVMGVHFVQEVDIVENFNASSSSALEGFYLAFKSTLQAQSRLTYQNNQWYLDSDGLMAVSHRNQDPPANSCAFGFSDPLMEVMRSINTLTLMSAQSEQLYYGQTQDASNPNYPYDHNLPIGDFSTSLATWQNTTATVHYLDVFYVSTQIYMYIALGLTFFVVLCIAPVFWGFWQLGRKVTLGPFEIASAFQGPAFAGVKGSHVNEVLKSVGQQRVVYGQMTHDDGQRLGFKIA